jgi:hypothetical protein
MLTSLFRRRHQESEAPSSPVATGVACGIPGCANKTATPCGYRDRRGRMCQTLFCPEHGATIYGIAYCRRHASTVQAIGELANDPNGLPDVNDRTPSLVNWISRDLNDHIRAQLLETARPGEEVIADDAVRLSRDNNRNLRWERSWRLVESTGLVLKITIHVSEENDALVRISVGSEMVADGIPPWIARRRMGEEVDMAIDIAQRRLFYQYLAESIERAVAEFRVGGERLSGR